VVRLLTSSSAALATIAILSLAPANASAADCTLASTNGTVTQTLGSQSYELHVPQGLTGTQVPLLVVLHGFGSNGSTVETFSGWSGFADSNNFIVAYPNARPATGGGAWDPYSNASPDVGFLRDVVADISATWCVDPRRVHVDGWSNGAVMSQRVACNAADQFASVTSYAGGTPTLAGFGAEPCNPSRPISVGLIVGQFDFTFPALSQNTSEWRGYNSCAATGTRTTDAHGYQDVYSCAAGTKVLSRVVSATSHNWPSGAKGADQRARMWAFFQANPLP
jgi:polyhydroxybutyrate depolymerase